MSRLLLTIMVLGAAIFLVAPFAWPQERTEPQLSPVTPPIAREGDFAVRLLETLGLGSAKDEVEAESLLASKGIAPGNGWIADYPVTPTVLGELREAVLTASASGSLPMDGASASAAFDSLAMELGMAPDQTAGDTYASAGAEVVPPPPVTSVGEYPAYYDTYYTDGPPIYTYYAPPYAYYSLYDWVPWPFYFTGVHFSGYFVLRDFHRHCRWNDRFLARGFVRGDRFKNRFLSNHRFDSVQGRTARVRPAVAFRDLSRAGLDATRGLNRGSGGSSVAGVRGLSGQGLGGGRRDLLSSQEAARTDLSSVSRRSEGFGRRASVQNSLRERGSDGSLDFRNNTRSSSESFGNRRTDALRLGSFSRGSGDALRGDRAFRGSGGSGFRTFGSSGGREGGSFRSFNASGGGGGGSFRSFRSSGSFGGGASFRSFNSGGGGFSGRGGGGFSMRGGGGGGRRGR